MGQDATYEARKEREAARQRQASAAGRDIGPVPKCLNSKRRAKAEASLQACCEIYFKARFPLPWSDDHLEQLAEIERVVTSGGLQAIAAPRGDGKTTRLEIGVFWGVCVIAAHAYGVLLTATAAHAPKRMASLKRELLSNDVLLEDFPEICYPIRAMGGIANRCAGQICEGVPTQMAWSKRQVVLPTIAGSRCSSSVLECAGLLEATRGLNYARPDGAIIRPTVALIDDPQTNRSARSVRQSEEREEAIAAGILHLPGPDRSIAALLSCTVIQPGDMADCMLDREAHPEWHGIRKKLVYSFPSDWETQENTQAGSLRHWDQYAELYRQDLAAGGEGKKATAFYRRHKKAMDAGAKVAWKHRKSPGEASAIEHAMRLLIRDRRSFFSEMQNEPEADVAAGAIEILTAEQIAAKVSGYQRGQIPPAVDRLTCFIDVGKELLYWCVCGWQAGFTGHVIDYGTWPEQSVTYFDAKHARQTISRDKRITATTLEGRLAQALDACLAGLAVRDWMRDDKAAVDLELTLIDANWGDSTNTVYDVCRQAKRKHGLRVMPSHGVPFGPTKKPISQWPAKTTKGARGDEWHVPPPNRGRAIRHVLFDAGRRKSCLHRRLSTPAGDPGSLTLFHAPASRHRCLAEHLTSETGAQVSGPHGDLTIWTLIPGRDNHWLDCLSGCCTAESMLGGKLAAPVVPSTRTPKTAASADQAKPKRQKVRYL